MTDWWTALYNEHLADVLLEPASPAEVDATMSFLVKHLALNPGDRVFDQCCGIGRLSLPLARWGAEVVGVEQAAGYVDRARAQAGELRASFHVGDAFAFVPDRPSAAALNWWTSFGYLPDDDANARMLARAFESLVPGGRFAIDTPNVPGLYASFRPSEITRRTTPIGEVVMLRESWFELARGLLHKRWTFVLPDGQRIEQPSTLKLYSPDRMVALLAQVGFVDLQVYGGLDSRPIALDSPRCIVVGRKPAEVA